MGSSDSRLTAQLGTDVGHWIGGAEAPGTAQDRYADVYNPATGAVARRVALATPAQVDVAVKAAAAAFPAWSATPALRRARVLFKFKELAERHSGELAALITAEHGKPLPQARLEVIRGCEFLEWDAGEAVRTFQGHSDGVRSVALTPDERLLVSASIDRTLRVWDVATRRQLAAFQVHDRAGLSVAVSAARRHIRSAARLARARISGSGAASKSAQKAAMARPFSCA